MFYSDSEKVLPKLTPNAIQVLKDRKYLRGETPEEMFWRVANHIAQAEKSYLVKANFTNEDIERRIQKITTLFYNMMATLDFLPGTPTLMNAGRQLGQLSSCFVIPIEDSMEGIFGSVRNMAMVQKSGGGTGFSFSRLRPKGDDVTTTYGEASGPVSFMKVFNSATEAIKQGGVRRGANMAILRVDHPDILEFIECKKDTTQLTNFNISVGITHEFIDCLEKQKPFTLKFNGREYTKIDPNIIFCKLIHYAWLNGEPGVVFLDNINEKNTVPDVGEIESTNPCGEQPLLPYESCNLGSINLANMIKKQPKLDPIAINNINFKHLDDTITLAVEFLDNVIDMNNYPLPEIYRATIANRKIGLGVMGWADLLYQLHIPYGSEESIKLAKNIMGHIQHVSHKISRSIAEIRGSFPNWDKSIFKDTDTPMRNATTITIAPTGSLAVIAGVSSGIEANFALCYNKHLTDGKILDVINPYFDEYIRNKYSADEYQDILHEIKETGAIKSRTELNELFPIAHEIRPEIQVEMQAAFQEFTDNAVSKTINFDNSVAEKDIANAVLLANKLKCKGLTVYRDGSRKGQPLTKGDERTSDDKTESVNPLQRPEKLHGETIKVKTGCGVMFVTINTLDDAIYEVFLRAGSSGGCSAFGDAAGRLISIGLRYGVPIEEIIGQLNSVRCDNFRYQTGKNPELKGKSCADVVGRLLKEKMEELTGRMSKSKTESKAKRIQPTLVRKVTDVVTDDYEKCPVCGSKLRRDGCVVCMNCGYSRC